MVTIKDVATKAGVSISTVSNVINKRKFVSDELIERVNITVQELGYVANPIAQNMKLKNTKTVGVITSDLCGLFYPYVLKGIYEVLNAGGYKVIVIDLDGMNDRLGSIKKFRDGVESLIFSRVDGIIFSSTLSGEMEVGIINEIKETYSYQRDIGLVCIESDLSKFGVDSVFSDSVDGADKATSHLINIGCKRIGHITGPLFISVVQERIAGYKNAMSRSGFAVDDATMISNGDYTHRSGYLAMKDLLHKMPDIDGAFIANDQMSIGALKALSEEGKAVPDEVKIVGYDDVFIASVMEPALSTIHIKKHFFGKKAAELLVEQIEGKKQNHPAVAIEIETSLVERKSTVKAAPEDWILVNW